MQRLFAQAVPPSGQLLQIVSNGRAYRFGILHAEFGTRRTPERGLREHAHDVYHIVMISRGSNRVLFNGREVPVRRGTLFLADPCQPHAFAPCYSGEISYHEVTFDLNSTSALRLPFNELLSLYAGTELPSCQMPHELGASDTRLLEEKFELLLTRLVRNDSFAAYTLLLDMFAFLAERVLAPRSGATDPMLAIQKLLESRYRDSLSLRELAVSARLSPAYVCRAFKKRFGRTPMDYQCELRIRAARNLLLSTSLSCKEIAARVGFCDVYTFSKAFRRKAGRSPSHLREGTRGYR
jgi:AraC-like DNA-binding protein